MNIKLFAGVVVDLYAASSITVGMPLGVSNLGANSVYLSTTIGGLAMDASGNCQECQPGEAVMNAIGDQGAFAICYSGNTIINVTEDR